MNQTSNYTLDYYNSHATEFVEGTKNVDFSEIQNAFASRIRMGGKVLDLGCGSGRDSKAFLERGFQVTAVDGAQELCDVAADFIGQPVICSDFRSYEPEETFDGIWACASLLHLPKEDVRTVISKLADHLTDNGCFYLSFKYGTFSGERNGRYFSDFTEETVKALINETEELQIEKMWLSSDKRPGREDEKWLNIYLRKQI